MGPIAGTQPLDARDLATHRRAPRYESPTRHTLRSNDKAEVPIVGAGRDSIRGFLSNDPLAVAKFSANPTIETADGVSCGRGRKTELLNKASLARQTARWRPSASGRPPAR